MLPWFSGIYHLFHFHSNLLGHLHSLSWPDVASCLTNNTEALRFDLTSTSAQVMIPSIPSSSPPITKENVSSPSTSPSSCAIDPKPSRLSWIFLLSIRWSEQRGLTVRHEVPSWVLCVLYVELSGGFKDLYTCTNYLSCTLMVVYFTQCKLHFN